MSTPYPPQEPRKLQRSKSNKIIGGVCGGVAAYLNMDPTLVRVLTVVISLFTGLPVILYIIALFVIPEEQPQPQPGQHVPPVGDTPRAGGDEAIWGSAGAPWAQGQPSHAPGTPAPAAEPADWQQPPPATPAASEPLPESRHATPPAEEASTWESAPAHPERPDGEKRS